MRTVPFSSKFTTTGPSYACWRCGQQILEGCTHHCPTHTPVVHLGTSMIASGLSVVIWP